MSSLFGGIGGVLGSGMKAARVGDQIDAEVKGALSIASNTIMTLDQFDFVETQLAQFGQLLQQENPLLAQQFQNLVNQINNIQGQAKNGISQIQTSLRTIDSHTNVIQG
ncbi:hypothetical protein [Peribacillus frigoritolerans]|uniref:Uncharacterized protein n=1 Tax=Peribacillus castrilensis TaxID=2897690 RepID=A0AAW9NKX7_9BACI|nr:hypothetical protein [Peribacillus castrilensis]